ncbi:hypothetical protein HGRIS_008420 [Hohenbuehelia grisea]|uniref:Uncharacterized protein n=1 Tax=Hohenbuehelia grisea TaxID=104357 RepID=A0ABR3J8D3_9AGAR
MYCPYFNTFTLDPPLLAEPRRQAVRVALTGSVKYFLADTASPYMHFWKLKQPDGGCRRAAASLLVSGAWCS